jgi:PAS domain S-box-containing protein
VPRGFQLKSCAIQLTENERTFPEDDVIVSKTDLKGRITYVNQTFMDVSGYTEEELLGKPHNIIRHPEMPRCVFKLMWDTLEARREIFAYVTIFVRTAIITGCLRTSRRRSTHRAPRWATTRIAACPSGGRWNCSMGSTAT